MASGSSDALNDNSEQGLVEYADRSTLRSSGASLGDPEVGPILRKWKRVLHPNAELDKATDPIEIEGGDVVRSIELGVTDKAVVIHPTDSAKQFAASFSIRSSNSVLHLSTAEPFWKTEPPEFASAYGRDEFGSWFEFEVNGDKRRGHSADAMDPSRELSHGFTARRARTAMTTRCNTK